MRRNQTLGNYSKVKRNLHLRSNYHIYLTSIIYYFFAQTDLEYNISCYFSISAFVSVLYSHRHGMLAWYQITWCQMNVFHVTWSCSRTYCKLLREVVAYESLNRVASLAYGNGRVLPHVLNVLFM